MLASLKSFTRRDFHPFQTTRDELLATIRAASPVESEAVSPIDEEKRPSSSRLGNRLLSPRQVTIQSGHLEKAFR